MNVLIPLSMQEPGKNWYLLPLLVRESRATSTAFLSKTAQLFVVVYFILLSMAILASLVKTHKLA